MEFLTKPSTGNFLESARTFVALLELDNIGSKEFYKSAHTALADLYAFGQKLKLIDLKYSLPDVDHDELVPFENKNANKVADL